MDAIANTVGASDAIEIVNALLGSHGGAGSDGPEDGSFLDPEFASNGSALISPVAALLQQLFNITLSGNGSSPDGVALGQSLMALSPLLATFTPFASFSPLLIALSPILTAFYPLVQTLLTQYLTNELFAASLWLAAILLGGRFLLARLSWVWTWFRQQGVVSVSISPNEEAFEWIQEWLNDWPRLKSNDLKLTTKWEDEEEYERSPTERPQLLFLPKLKAAQRIHFKGTPVTFQLRNTQENADAGGGGRGGDLGELLRSMGREELVIQARSRVIVEGVVQAAMEAHMKKKEKEKKTSIRRWSCESQCWMYVGDRPARPFDSVIVDVDTAGLLSDAKRFASSTKWYSDRGIPHRRGFLFHGPPGCGKTSLIQALAGEMDYDVCVISLSSAGMNDDVLHTAMSECLRRSVFILEDVDAAFTRSRSTSRKASRSSALSFSGLLNAIDGVSAQEGRLLVMTTNHIERLDPALIRPGRIDVRLFLGLASRSQIARLFLRFYPEAGEGMARRFAAHFEESSVSPASLQGFFLTHREHAEEALAHVEEFVEEERKAGEKRRVEEEKRKEGREAKNGKKGRKSQKEGRKKGEIEELVEGDVDEESNEESESDNDSGSESDEDSESESADESGRDSEGGSGSADEGRGGKGIDEEEERLNVDEGIVSNRPEAAAISDGDDSVEEVEPVHQRKKKKSKKKKMKGVAYNAEEAVVMEQATEVEVEVNEAEVFVGADDARVDEESSKDEWKQIKGKSRRRRKS